MVALSPTSLMQCGLMSPTRPSVGPLVYPYPRCIKLRAVQPSAMLQSHAAKLKDAERDTVLSGTCWAQGGSSKSAKPTNSLPWP